MRRVTVLLLLVAVARPVTCKGFDVQVNPELPDSSTAVSVIISGRLGGTGLALDHVEHQITLFKITIDMYWTGSIFDWSPPVDFSHVEPIGHLIPGQYTISVSCHGSWATLEPTEKTFTVMGSADPLSVLGRIQSPVIAWPSWIADILSQPKPSYWSISSGQVLEQIWRDRVR